MILLENGPRVLHFVKYDLGVIPDSFGAMGRKASGFLTRHVYGRCPRTPGRFVMGFLCSLRVLSFEKCLGALSSLTDLVISNFGPVWT